MSKDSHMNAMRTAAIGFRLTRYVLSLAAMRQRSRHWSRRLGNNESAVKARVAAWRPKPEPPRSQGRVARPDGGW